MNLATRDLVTFPLRHHIIRGIEFESTENVLNQYHLAIT